MNPNVTTALEEGIIRPEEDVGAFRSQLLDSHCGKVLRIDADSGDGVRSNPWFDPASPRSARSRVWALGLRNPYRATVVPHTGSHDPDLADPGTVLVVDVGLGSAEELNVIKRGGAEPRLAPVRGATSAALLLASRRAKSRFR